MRACVCGPLSHRRQDCDITPTDAAVVPSTAAPPPAPPAAAAEASAATATATVDSTDETVADPAKAQAAVGSDACAAVQAEGTIVDDVGPLDAATAAALAAAASSAMDVEPSSTLDAGSTEGDGGGDGGDGASSGDEGGSPAAASPAPSLLQPSSSVPPSREVFKWNKAILPSKERLVSFLTPIPTVQEFEVSGRGPFSEFSPSLSCLLFARRPVRAVARLASVATFGSNLVAHGPRSKTRRSGIRSYPRKPVCYLE